MIFLLLAAFVVTPSTMVLLSPKEPEAQLTAEDFDLDSAAYPPDSDISN